MAVMKKCLVRCLCLLLAMSLSAAGALAESPASPGMAYLAGEMESAAGLLMAYGQDVDIYASREWHRDLVAYPEKLDLRELGLVTPVKSQNPGAPAGALARSQPAKAAFSAPWACLPRILKPFTGAFQSFRAASGLVYGEPAPEGFRLWPG